MAILLYIESQSFSGCTFLPLKASITKKKEHLKAVSPKLLPQMQIVPHRKQILDDGANKVRENFQHLGS